MDFKKEQTIMSQLVHPNIVRFYGLICDEGTINLFMLNNIGRFYKLFDTIDTPSIILEYLHHGDLRTFLQVGLFILNIIVLHGHI